MVSLTFSAIQVLLVLLPGFFAARIVGALTVRPSETDLDKIIEALFYSFFVYFVCVAFLGVNPLIIHFVNLSQPTNVGIDLAAIRSFVIYAFIVATLLGLIISFLDTNDILTQILRRAHVTRRSSRISVWSDVFHDLDDFVIVEFNDGRRVRGWPRLFSDTFEEGSLFLERAAWILDDGTPVEVDGPGMLITKNLPVQTISFVNAGK